MFGRVFHYFWNRKVMPEARVGLPIRLVLFFLALTPLPPALGQDVSAVFVTGPQPFVADREKSVWLYCLNSSGKSITYTFEGQIDCQLIAGETTCRAMLYKESGRDKLRVRIPNQGFYKVKYLLRTPEAATGQFRIEVAQYNEFLCNIVPPPLKANHENRQNHQSEAPPGVVSTPNASASSALVTFFDEHIFPYEPIYFILGTYPAAEFQFSLKYKLLDGARPWNPAANAYFAYTQTSFWDLLSADPSFYDTSYKPSAFLYYTDVLPASCPVHLDLQSGVEHESNGRGGADERSLYTVYLQPTLNYALTTNLLFTLQPRGWYYLALGDNNKDLADYRGYADLYAAVTWQSESWEKIQLSSKLRVGDAGWHTGEQVDFLFFLPPIGRYHFNPAIDVQYFSGYGQTLRQYNQISHGLRAGFCLTF